MKFEKEIHQECENFITYNVYKVINEKEKDENKRRKFLYRTSINKIQDMYSKPRKELYKMDAVARGEV